MKTNTKWVLALLLLALAGGAVVMARRSPPPPPAVEEKAAEAVLELAAADLASAEAGEIRRVLPVTGALRAVSQAVVKAKVAGEVAEVLVKEGDAVKSGQLMARIDATEYRARLNERAATLEASRAQAKFAEQSRKKYEELLARKFISETAYDNYLTNASVTEKQVLAVEAQLVQARKSLEDTQVHAPIAGSVSERALQRGDKASVDSRLFTIVDLSRLELEAPVPAAEVPNIAVGQQVRFRVEGFGEKEFAGSIVRINPATQPGTRSILIYVEIPNPEQALKAGMFAKGSLTLATQRAEVLVPLTALRTEAAATFVYVVSGDRIARQDVTVGLVNEAEGRAEIVKGLAPGARIVRMNLGALKVGAPVRVVAPRQPQ
jgi:RND family efflux transporter MFP subunit